MARKSLLLRQHCQAIFHSKKAVFFLPIFQNFKNWASKGKLGKYQKCSEYLHSNICKTHLRHCGKKVQFSRDFRIDGAHI